MSDHASVTNDPFCEPSPFHVRYWKQHFKHGSLDMTLGYALNESPEMALYAEINDELEEIKASVVESWLNPDAHLAGGYGTNIVAWRGTNPVTLFRDHKQMVRSLAESTAIRSNGHAGCTADGNLCVGNDIERTRCSDAVIGLKHASLYRGLHDHLNEVRQCDDISAGRTEARAAGHESVPQRPFGMGQDAPEVEA